MGSGWYLGVIHDKNIECREPLAETEYEEFRRAISAINGLRGNYSFRLVEENFRGLLSTEQYVGIVISVGRAIGDPDRMLLAESVMTATINWLASMRLYLDHTEFQLKRRFGKTSEQWLRFQKATAEAFDNAVGYRFAYKFRNYVQHCGMPLSHMRVDGQGPPDQRTQLVQFLLDRDQLIANYGDEWRQVRDDLLAMPDTFPFGPLLTEAMERLRDIEHERLRIEVSAAATVRAALDRLGTLGPGEAPILTTVRSLADGAMNLGPMPIPDAAIDTLLKIEAGEESPDSIIGQPPLPPLPAMDPATVKQRLHVDTRGVQALSLFLEQGGSTPVFVAGLQQILEEDNGADHLIVGLLNVSIVTLNAAAAAIGATAQGFLGGKLNFYSRAATPGAPTEPPASGAADKEQ